MCLVAIDPYFAMVIHFQYTNDENVFLKKIIKSMPIFSFMWTFYFIFKAPYEGNFTDICTILYCFDNDGQNCNSYLGGDGIPCGDKKVMKQNCLKEANWMNVSKQDKSSILNRRCKQTNNYLQVFSKSEETKITSPERIIYLLMLWNLFERYTIFIS